MKRLTTNQSGFGLVAVVILLVVVAGVGLVGYRVLNNTYDTTPLSSPVAKSGKAPTAISSKADVTKAAAALDATPVDSGVNPNQLDSDLNSLL